MAPKSSNREEHMRQNPQCHVGVVQSWKRGSTGGKRGRSEYSSSSTANFPTQGTAHAISCCRVSWLGRKDSHPVGPAGPTRLRTPLVKANVSSGVSWNQNCL